jgi:hypothetical protein
MSSFNLKIEFLDTLDRPGITIAQVLREVTPLIELMIPLQDGSYADRFSGVTKATWELKADEPTEPEPQKRPQPA